MDPVPIHPPERARPIRLIRVVALSEPVPAILPRSKPQRLRASGIIAEFSSIAAAAMYIAAKCKRVDGRPCRRYEVAISFTDGDRIVGTFDDDTEAILFLRRLA